MIRSQLLHKAGKAVTHQRKNCVFFFFPLHEKCKKIYVCERRMYVREGENICM